MFNWIIAATVAAAGLNSGPRATVAPPATGSAAFDQITYEDSGGFTGGGTGKSLTLTATGNLR